MRTDVWEYANLIRNAVGRGAPYLLIELVLPGGTLIAFMIFLYQRRRNGGAPLPANALVRWFAQACNRVSLAFSTWHFATGPGPGKRDGLEAIGAFGLLPAR